ncbi:hypothetical protein [Rhizobium sp. AAP43]|uniref:hypothetical protein n=1 Tax=Rhizobium sp. AAP43 TaxID=1523420 RepID=UPI000A9ADFC4|nr:hypothetical protein [Rhizobium sp. AAP43]
MKAVLTHLLANLPVILCLLFAFYMVVNGIGGWGWFLVIAFFLRVVVSINKGAGA